MKKIIAITILVAALAIGLALPAAAQPPAPDVNKVEGSTGPYELTDEVWMYVQVDCYDAGTVVEDMMPEGLSLVDVVEYDAAGDYELEFDENGFVLTLLDIGWYDFDVYAQVTDVSAEDTITVCNTATATDSLGQVGYDEVCFDLLPYDCFSKELVWTGLDDGTTLNPEALPTFTDVYFLMYINGDNCLDETMYDVVIKDNLGGDIELEYWAGPNLPDVRATGKTQKQHLSMEIGDLEPGNGFATDLYVSTDVNTGTGNGKKPGKQEYTDEESTCHDLNSGATMKFNLEGNPFTFSVTTGPIEVCTYVPVS